MATRRDEQLLDLLGAPGLRKRAERVISEVTGAGRTAGGEVEKRARAVIADLRTLADELEARLTGGSKRKVAAQKAAATRASNARKRSTAAKKAAATRARSSSSSRSGTSSSRSTAAKKAAATRARKSTSGSGTTSRARSTGTKSRARATAGSRSR
jgi:RNA polymerase primary sigma factor